MALETSRIGLLDTAIGDFHVHLDRGIYLGWRFGSGHEQEPNLLDSIQHWLEHGDAVVACGSYENYLLVVINIIGEWAVSDNRNSFGLTSIWPRWPADPDGHAVPLASREHSEAASAVRDLARFCFEHPAFDPDSFVQLAE